MKLIYIFNGRFPTEKAHGIQIANMCGAFAQCGIQVTLVTPHRRSAIREDPFSYYGIQKNFKLQRVWAFDVMSFMPDRVAHFVQTITSLISFSFYLLGHHADIYYARDYATLALLCFLGFHPVAELHDYRSPKPKKLIRFILNRCRAVIFNSEGTKSLVIHHYSFIIPALVAPNGVDIKFFDIPETREQARTILHLPHDKIIIGYVGRFEVAGMDKGVGVLQKAFDIMQLRARAELLLVTSVPYKQVPLYLRAIDIAVVPFPGAQHAQTTSPIKLFEYMAAGKAIVVADSPNPQQLAEKLNALIAEPERIRTLDIRAREEAKDHTWDKRAQAILNFIQ